MKRVLRALVNHNPDQKPELFKDNTSRCASVQNLSCKTVTVGSYQLSIEETIAEGGFALVFLARALNGQKFALKRMFVNSEQDLEVCRREIEIMKHLKHSRNVVQLVESSIKPSGEGIYEVMILMHYCNDSLLNLMNDRLQNGFSEKEVLDIFCDLCSGLLDIHLNDPPIIHRDLKVENVLIDNQGRYLICDFGSATFDDSSQCESNSDSTVSDDEPPPPPSRSSSLSSIDLATQLAKSNNDDVQQSNILRPVDYSVDKKSCIAINVQSPKIDQTKRIKKFRRDQRTVVELEEEIKKYTTLSYRAPELVDLYNNIPITVKSDIWALGCLLYKICFSNLPFGESVLAIQNGTFTIPQDSEYSSTLHRLICYMLDTNVETRPNIKQLTLLAFKLAGKQSSTPKEALGEVCPDINTLTLSMPNSELQNEIRQNSFTSPSSQRPNSSFNNPLDTSQNSSCTQEISKRNCFPIAKLGSNPITITSTSVAPLQRPRKNHRHLVIPTPPPPSLQHSGISNYQLSAKSPIPSFDQKCADISVPPRPHSSTTDNDDMSCGLELNEIRRATGRSNEDLVMSGVGKHGPSQVSHSQSDTRLAANLNPFVTPSSHYSTDSDFGRENRFETFDENKNSSKRKDLSRRVYAQSGAHYSSSNEDIGNNDIDSNLTPNEELRLREICDNILNPSDPQVSTNRIGLQAYSEDYGDDDDHNDNDKSDSSFDSDRDDADAYPELAHVRLETDNSPPDHLNLPHECNDSLFKSAITPSSLKPLWSVEIKDKELVSANNCNELDLSSLRLKPPPSVNPGRVKQNVWPSSIPRQKVVARDGYSASVIQKFNNKKEFGCGQVEVDSNNETMKEKKVFNRDQHDYKEKEIVNNEVDPLIGHTDGHRPLLDDDDSGEEGNNSISQHDRNNSPVKS